ncbi:unnamed protein product [Camellia sinensis]
MKMSNKKINLEFETFSISVFYKRQNSQVKVLFISLLLRAFTSNSAESSDRDDNSGLSISDCMEKCWNNCSCVGFTISNSNASPEKFSGFQIKHSRKLQNSPINGRLKRKYKGHELYTKHNELASVKMSSATFIDIIVAILLPPLGVFLKFGCEVEFWICLLLTLFGYLPGILYAIYIITKCGDVRGDNKKSFSFLLMEEVLIYTQRRLDEQ